jgi:putative transposase
MTDHATDVALFRYSLVRALIDESLTKAERGALVRSLAARGHLGPGGVEVHVSRPSIDRWVRALRNGGFEALKPEARHANPRTPPEVLELAERLRRERPERTAAHICELIRMVSGWAPDERTIQRHFFRAGLSRRETRPKVAFGRFEAARPNELWTGDALHGPVIGGHKTYLFAFIDDHSRAFTGYRWGYAEDTVRLEAALRAGIERRGVPEAAYLDNGSAMVSRQLLRALAVLGTRLLHSEPGRPEGRGKIERAFRTVRGQFLVEVDAAKVTTLDELNSRFSAWVESVYHRRVHSETNETPIGRFLSAGPPTIPPPELLREAFLWSEHRQVAKTATVNLFGNHYEVDPALVGRRVELAFDAFDLTHVEVRFEGRAMGEAVAHVTRRHSHPRAVEDPTPPVEPSGIDYLGLVTARHHETLEQRIAYVELPEGERPEDIVTTWPSAWDLATDRPIEEEGQ